MAASRPLQETLDLLLRIAEAETLDAEAAILHDPGDDGYEGARVADGLPATLVGPTADLDDDAAREAWSPIVEADAGDVHHVDELPEVLRGPASAAGYRSLWVWPSVEGPGLAPVTAVAWRREDHLDVDQAAAAVHASLAGDRSQRSREAMRRLDVRPLCDSLIAANATN